jgi:hypothetical protein
MLCIQKEPVKAGFGKQLAYCRGCEGHSCAQEQVSLMKSLTEMVAHVILL